MMLGFAFTALALIGAARVLVLAKRYTCRILAGLGRRLASLDGPTAAPRRASRQRVTRSEVAHEDTDPADTVHMATITE